MDEIKDKHNHHEHDYYHDHYYYDYRRFHFRKFEPWYSNQADYNTNSKSYYDYLARFPFMFQAIEDVLNRLLARNLETQKTNTIELIKQGDWIESEKECICYDDVIELKANVILSNETESKTVQNTTPSTYVCKNSIKEKTTGLYSPDYFDMIQKLFNDLKKLQNDLNDVANSIPEIPDFPDIPKDMETTVTKEIWKGSASVNDTFTLSQSIFDFDTIIVQYAVGGAQYSVELYPTFLKHDMPNVPKFSGIDFSGETEFKGYTGIQCTDSSGKNMKVREDCCLTVYSEIKNNGIINNVFRAAGTKDKTGSAIVQYITGALKIKYT